LAVAANSRIPLGIVIAPSECWQVCGMLVDALPREGYTNLDHLPLLSSEAKALAKYQQSHHPAHDLCYGDFLESLGSGMFVALLARRLPSRQTTSGFQDIVEQATSDFVTGCGGILSRLLDSESCRTCSGLTECPTGIVPK
jgi:hypothetical protein